MRAAELGMPLIHTAVTGRSTLISPTGETGPRTALAEEALLIGEVRSRAAGQGPTLYVRLGDWVQTLAIASLAWEMLHGMYRRRYPQSSPTPPLEPSEGCGLGPGCTGRSGIIYHVHIGLSPA